MPQPALSIGEQAPDFELRSTEGEPIRLYTVLEHSSVVLFFYVKAFTPVCMAEVCAFRDHLGQFQDVNSNVFGVSPDAEPVAKRFAKYHQLPYPLLLDPGNRVRNLYGVPRVLAFLPGRSTFVIAKDKKILRVTHAGFESGRHIRESLQSLRHAG